MIDSDILNEGACTFFLLFGIFLGVTAGVLSNKINRKQDEAIRNKEYIDLILRLKEELKGRVKNGE